eukprot:6182478-Pleurochrysis_carterae.AAC.1
MCKHTFVAHNYAHCVPLSSILKPWTTWQSAYIRTQTIERCSLVANHTQAGGDEKLSRRRDEGADDSIKDEVWWASKGSGKLQGGQKRRLAPKELSKSQLLKESAAFVTGNKKRLPVVIDASATPMDHSIVSGKRAKLLDSTVEADGAADSLMRETDVVIEKSKRRTREELAAVREAGKLREASRLKLKKLKVVGLKPASAPSVARNAPSAAAADDAPSATADEPSAAVDDDDAPTANADEPSADVDENDAPSANGDDDGAPSAFEDARSAAVDDDDALSAAADAPSAA